MSVKSVNMFMISKEKEREVVRSKERQRERGKETGSQREREGNRSLLRARKKGL